MASGVMPFCLFLTIVAFCCQSIAVFLPGWTTLKSGSEEIQVGVWYKCVNWTNCETQIKDLTSRKAGVPLDSALVIRVVSETLAFILLLISSTMLCFVVCCSSSRSSNLINVTIRVIIGLNMAASWSIVIGVLQTDIHYFKNVYGFGVVLAIVACILSLLSTFVSCFENQSYRSRRRTATGYPPSDMYAANTISKSDYYHSNHMPYPNYHHHGGATSFYG